VHVKTVVIGLRVAREGERWVTGSSSYFESRETALHDSRNNMGLIFIWGTMKGDLVSRMDL
jgi:hypothetical protein